MAEISDFIDQVIDQDFAKAQPTFAELIGDKMSNAMEQEKIAMAGQVFNGDEPDAEEADEPEVDDGDGSEEFTDEPLATADEVEELDDIDIDNITDEEIEDAIDDAEQEEEPEE